jgi:hypothetical protein
MSSKKKYFMGSEIQSRVMRAQKREIQVSGVNIQKFLFGVRGIDFQLH